MLEVTSVAEGVYRVNLTEADADRIKELAAEDNRTNSDVIQSLIVKGMIAKTGNEPEKVGDNDL